MRTTLIAAFCGLAMLLAPSARAQYPQPPSPPPAPYWPPPAWQPPPPPQEDPPVRAAGRLGFGLGVWVNPVNLAGGGSAGELGFGTAAGLRWWVTEGVALVPSLRLAIAAAEGQKAEGVFAPEILFGFAAYRGRKTRVVLTVGPSFSYAVGGESTQTPSAQKQLAFAILGGLGLEHFFTPTLSIVVASESPLFQVRSITIGHTSQTAIGAGLDATRFNASIFFYTD